MRRDKSPDREIFSITCMTYTYDSEWATKGYERHEKVVARYAKTVES